MIKKKVKLVARTSPSTNPSTNPPSVKTEKVDEKPQLSKEERQLKLRRQRRAEKEAKLLAKQENAEPASYDVPNVSIDKDEKQADKIAVLTHLLTSIHVGINELTEKMETVERTLADHRNSLNHIKSVDSRVIDLQTAIMELNCNNGLRSSAHTKLAESIVELLFQQKDQLIDITERLPSIGES